VKTITIIGGGFCGILTAFHILNKSKSIQVNLINDGQLLGRGIAYSTEQPEHLLNVPAGKMSAFSNDANHFIDWLKSQSKFKNLITDNLKEQFIPRYIYGLYLDEIVKELTGKKNLQVINGKVISVKQKDNKYSVTLASQRIIECDTLVLAMGNYLPANPKIENKLFLKSKNYFQNPWKNNFINGVKDDETILLLGSGLTMVDCVLSLVKKEFKGKIIAISPRGYIPASHTRTIAYIDFYYEIRNKSLKDIFHITRNHLTKAKDNNIPWQSVIDVIRPHAQEIWKSFSDIDKQQFVSHVRHIWGVARHRLPQDIFQQIFNMMDTKQLQIIGGRINDMIEKDGSIEIHYKLRKSKSINIMNVSRVVNCTGPQMNFKEVDDELVTSLVNENLISPIDLKMGIKTSVDGEVINRENGLVKNVYAIGSLLRGVLWESTAVPELRVQAENIAERITQE
jgi:uncharacterized NAD(P)/FAD-binding protein YdhS